jgi:hypothetical protein
MSTASAGQRRILRTGIGDALRVGGVDGALRWQIRIAEALCLALSLRRQGSLRLSLPKGRDVTWDSSESPLVVTSECSVIRAAPDFIDIAVVAVIAAKDRP